ncbi:hypothetical protein EWM64_g8687 [Hericium alpestre]|uniref:Methyltransferase type 11 domain-containing protein n=1 Tax=Hericium alpestre TaxID=135208 RepID=A0A4Y9ZL22_9AGAM|nr:hypothetical protein EWM64_g8687 [Hericium alpestre]
MSVAVGQTPVPPKSASAGYGLATDENDWDRLDAMHNGINQFLAKKLTPARHIAHPCLPALARAPEHAARQFPNAEVTGGDINHFCPVKADLIITSPVPANTKFQQLDLRQPLPFEPGSFDVVHIRFVLCHLLHGHTLIPRLADLVAPGGWLLIDDVDMPLGIEGDVRALKQAMNAFHSYMHSDNQNGRLGSVLEPTLHQSRKFAEASLMCFYFILLTGRS